ncbi:hypothetical protein AK812_SmicGene22510 [Symbiodinium microadriaticum]|uniref:Copia protein n=1 Tax=Symbiodinium microadriaticum TaxID=2951 RepID=A0A1Q9DJM8_SYMMI|nr:hypothetical protein AK812_SmicGene22510 [Symbiodinium microadriaticum]
MEVACEHDSLLSTAVQELRQDPKAASRCALWNACDLRTQPGLQLILDRIRSEKPQHVWMSPPSEAWSPLQNLNKQLPKQRQELEAKRQESLRMYVSCACIIHECVQSGIHVTLELAASSHAWRLPILVDLQKKYGLFSAVTKGCRVGWRDEVLQGTSEGDAFQNTQVETPGYDPDKPDGTRALGRRVPIRHKPVAFSPKALRKRGASERVLQLASEFQCPVCIEKRRSQAVESYCDRHQIYLDVIPGEAHHQTGVCEESVKGLKEVMTKLCLADPEVSSEEALSTGICTFNQREHIRGFSPAQHILGVNPDEVGRCLPNTTHVPPGLLVENATGEFRRAVERRSTAEKAHSEWNAAQRLLRASNSRAKPVYDYKPGDLVYFWRSQGGGQSRTQPGNKHGSFLGPARVLATETRKDQDGSLRPGSAIWCVRGRRLLKCAPEQLRHASTREEILESLADSGQATPWTYTRVAEEIGGNQYEDLRDEIPDPSEWARAQDIHEEEPPTRHRARHKRRPDADTEQLRTEPTEVPSTSGPSRPSRAGPRGHPYRATASGHWTEETHETAWVTSHSAFWDDELACVALEVPVPETNRGINAFTRDLPTYFTTALRRQAMEVSEKRLTPEERESFRQAKSVEVKNFLAAQAFEALPEGSITRLKRACYGLVDAPLEWYRTIAIFLEELGLERTWCDACAWVWRQEGQVKGMISGHVDDFLFAGDSKDAGWCNILRKIQERFKWGDWDTDNFTQCGVQVKRVPEGFELSQPRYLEGLAEIPVNSQRRKSLEDPTTEREKSQLRALLGGDKEFSQDCATGQPALGPRQESQGSSEAQAAVNGEDLLYYARLQWGEILHGFPNVRAPDEVASSVKGCLVTDSRNVFDKLQTEVLSFRGAEKRTNVELLALKESQLSTQLLIRWVHSEAQLANALTKESSLAKELELFYRMDFRWKIVEDEEMKSARKRRSVGLEPLEGDAKTRG